MVKPFAIKKMPSLARFLAAAAYRPQGQGMQTMTSGQTGLNPQTEHRSKKNSLDNSLI
jgi:hypothetical protein